MTPLEQNWNNLFGDYTTDETAWYGHWTTYSPQQEVTNKKQVIRSFRSNSDNTAITHQNRYLSEEIEDKTWQIDRATCNQPDGVIHPAFPAMRALSFGGGATAWIAKQLVSGQPFGGEFFFQDHDQRSSVVCVYREDGQLDRVVHIQEHLGAFADESLSSEPSELAGIWSGNQSVMTADLGISPAGKVQFSFDQLDDHYKIISLPTNLILMLPKRVTIGQPVQIAVAQRTAIDQLRYIAAHYRVTGEFTSLISVSLQREFQRASRLLD